MGARADMRILAIADIHGSRRVLRGARFIEKSYGVDLILVAGDITNFGPPSFVDDLVSALESRILAVPGNCDPSPVIDRLEDLGVSIHGRGIRLGDRYFAGAGGSPPIPADTPFEIPDEAIGEIMRKALSGFNRGELILLTHAPPYRTKIDVIYSGSHVGSKSIKRIIEEKSPRLVVSGHIHEARGVDRIGDTILVNPGPAYKRSLALIELSSEPKVEFISF